MDTGCFRNLPAVNKVAMNIGVHVSFQITVFIFFGYIAHSGIVRSNAGSIFSFLGINPISYTCE